MASTKANPAGAESAGLGNSHLADDTRENRASRRSGQPCKFDHPVKFGRAILVERGSPRRQHVSYSQRTMAAVRKLIQWRHGGPCNTDDGELYVAAVLPLLVQIERERSRAPGWARSRTRELVPLLNRSEAWWAAQERWSSRRRGLTPDRIANLLRIHEHELDACFATKRKRCGLVSLERPKKVRKSDRATYRASWKRAQRTPREVYEAKSISRTKPWLEAGFNTRRTWERHGKPGVASVDVASPGINTSLDEEMIPTLATATPSIHIVVEPRKKREGWGASLAGSNGRYGMNRHREPN